MVNLAYVRVSTLDQNPERQICNIEERVKIDQDGWFVEKISGKNTDRPHLEALMKHARKGDVIYIDSFSRLARSAKDLLNLISFFRDKGAEVVSLKENLDTSTPTGKMMLTVIAAVSEFELEQLKERQAEGIEIAKSMGKYKGRKKIEISAELKGYFELWKKREITKTEVVRKTGFSRSTISRRFSELESESKL